MQKKNKETTKHKHTHTHTKTKQQTQTKTNAKYFLFIGQQPTLFVFFKKHTNNQQNTHTNR